MKSIFAVVVLSTSGAGQQFVVSTYAGNVTFPATPTVAVAAVLYVQLSVPSLFRAATPLDRLIDAF